ncbi:MAG: GNAT family N-acetyltransferase [Halobacteria archaeon]
MATAKLGGDAGVALATPDPAVRRATDRDLEEMTSLWLGCIVTSNTARDIEDAFRVHGRYFFVRIGGDGLEGFAAGTVKSRTRGHVSGVAVRPELRGRGLGRGLMRATEEAFRADGFTRVTLEVRPSNAAALQFYEGLGYRKVYRVPEYYFDGEDALVCEKNLLRLP